MSSCTRCAAMLPEGALFCPQCGKKQSVSPPRKPLKRANGTGTVYKLSGRRRRPWCAARNKVVIGYYATKTEALGALDALIGKSVTELFNLSFSEVYQRWSSEHFPLVSKSAVTQYRAAFAHCEALYQRRFRELRTADLQAVIDAVSDMAPTAEKIKNLMAQLYQWAMREEVCSSDFSRYVTLPKVQRTEKKIFTDADIAKLEADWSEAARVVLMLLATGMRISELFDLKLADYHGDYCIGGEKTEAGKDRIIPIRPEGRKHFEYFADLATGDRLLSGYKYSTSDSFRHSAYGQLLKRLGIEYKSPHATRHTYTSRAVAEGLKPEVLQRVLGHASYSTTVEIYTHFSAEQLVKEVEESALAKEKGL